MEKKPKKKLTIKQLRDKHMKDKNHIMTDEEINDLDMEINKTDRTTSHTPELPSKEERPKDEDKDKKMITPWDVIDQ